MWTKLKNKYFDVIYVAFLQRKIGPFKDWGFLLILNNHQLKLVG